MVNVFLNAYEEREPEEMDVWFGLLFERGVVCFLRGSVERFI